MKDFVKKASSFLFFDSPLQPASINANFIEIHEKLLVENPEWSTTGTRQKLAYQYWSVHVIQHFFVLYGLPALLFLFLKLNQASFRHSFITVIIVGIICYFILYLFHYRPKYCTTYLPILETIKESYDRKQFEQIEKCRQAQLSNFSLTLFFYVLTDINNLKKLICDDYSAILLMKLYGVDPGSIKKNLGLILGLTQKSNLTDRKRTELKNRFTETYEFLESLQFKEGLNRLKIIEAEFFK
jgi:hypothetical protein